MKTAAKSLWLAAATTVGFGIAPHAEPVLDAGVNTYGSPGLIEMPSALPRPDGELSLTTSYAGTGFLKNTLSFQITPRLSGSFRYSKIENYRRPGGVLYDRSFSLHYLIADETDMRPALAFGLNDILGTGVFAGEYVVATKTVTPRLRLTGGIGWGRLAGVGSFTNPLGILSDKFERRNPRDTGEGGEFEIDQFFRGDAAFFGGIEYQATDRLKLSAEYSSDAYAVQDGIMFERRSPLNLGLTYQATDRLDVSAQYLYGSEFGVQLTYALDPNQPRHFGGLDTAPPPVVPRPQGNLAALGWDVGSDTAATRTRVAEAVAQALDAQGLRLHGITLGDTVARVEIENLTYSEWSQAIGRTARVLTATLPPAINRFEIVPVKEGMPTAEVAIARTDMEELEFAFDNVWKSYARAEINEAGAPVNPAPSRYPDLDFGVSPYLVPSYFDPDSPVRLDFGAEFRAIAELAPGLSVQGFVRQRLLGNVGDATRPSDSPLPRVRSEAFRYSSEELTIPTLTGEYLFRPGDDLYGRITAGYLETQFGGFSGEILRKPVDSRLGLGLELNYVKQRDFDQRLGFRDYEVATGHASIYYEFDNGYTAQVDAGRYLAGDWGATLTLGRSFANGWKVEAFATLTDVPFDSFGEGSFDKGINITVPIDWISGRPTRQKFTTTLRPILRDGGARVNVANRLYEVVNDTHRADLEETWGRAWR